MNRCIYVCTDEWLALVDRMMWHFYCGGEYCDSCVLRFTCYTDKHEQLIIRDTELYKSLNAMCDEDLTPKTNIRRARKVFIRYLCSVL